jgi:hypothetical protein
MRLAAIIKPSVRTTALVLFNLNSQLLGIIVTLYLGVASQDMD